MLQQFYSSHYFKRNFKAILFPFVSFYLILLAIGETEIIEIIPIIIIFNTVLSRINLTPSPRIHCSLPLPLPRQPKLPQSNPAPSTILTKINKNHSLSLVPKIHLNISKISSQAPQSNPLQPNIRKNLNSVFQRTNQKRLVRLYLLHNHIYPHPSIMV